ncbi:MAG: AAA family ATPase, partial [Egibacteraceae bacterium]
MSNWPRWRRDGQPGALAQYVLPGEVTARLPGLPGSGGGDALGRLRGVYEAFAVAGIRYAHELPSDDPDWQVIRPPDHVLASPHHATCLDMAVTFAGACLAVELHPLVVIADSRVGGEAAHAVVVVWTRGGWAGRPDLGYPLERDSVLVGVDDETLQERGVRPFVDGPGEFVSVDPTCATARPDRGPASFEDAVAAGARVVRGEGWDWRVGVDVGIGFNEHECFRPALRPAAEPLDSPYEDPAGLDQRSLRLLRAEYGVVPFRGRDELDVLLDWARAPGRDGRPRLAVVTGVGGAGKTRLVAEFAHQLAAQGWHTGFVPRSPDPGLADWLAGTASPLLVAIDYAEARWAEAAQLITALRRRPGSPTCVVLTARELGNWYEQLDGALTESRIEPTTEPVHLAPSHVRPDRVFQRAFEAFSRRFGTPRPTPALPRLRDGRTTLDVVLRAWLTALGAEDLPETRSELYDEVLRHERRYWTKAYRSRSAEPPTSRLLDQAAACLTLLNPEPDRAGETLRAVKGLRRWREYLAETLTECLASRDGRLAVKPDPIGDRLVMKVFAADGKLLVRCLQRADETERLAGLVNLTRAADDQPEVATQLATEALAVVDGLWRPALAVAEAMGGPCVPGLAALAGRDDTPLPLVELAEQIPSGHATLRPVAFAAAERLVADHRVAGDDEPAELARLLNNLSLRLSAVGRRAEALEAITEAVTLYGRLAEDNPGAFLPDLAMSL